MPKCPVKITMNIGNPHLAFDFQALPNWGVGLARLEFVINNMIGVHPKAALEYPDLPAELKREVEHAARGYRDPRSFFVEKMTEGVATIAAAFWPKPVIVRLSDFKSNEYKKLIGGARLRARRGESDARIPRRVALYRQVVSPVLRDGMPGDAPGEKRARAHQCRDHGAVRAHPGRVRSGDRAARSERLEARGERPAAQS